MSEIWLKSLKLMCMIQYPEDIIPKEGYKISGFSLEDILHDLPDILISRRITGNINDYIDNDEKRPRLDTDCFGEHYVHLSVNLMNSKFRTEHIKYITKGEAGKRWDGKSICIKDYLAHIETSEDSSAVYYKVGTLHNHTFSKKQPLTKEPYKAMRKALGEMALKAFTGNESTKDAEFRGYIGIDHVPSNLNYWHCQVEIYPKDNENALQNDKSWRKEIFIHVLTNFLAYNFLTDNYSDYIIDTKHYKTVK